MAAEAGAADFGRYRLGRLLGRGGMGEVYLAHDVELDRDVAIKFVSADHAGDEAAARRLLHEAHAAAALDHPFICAVYETGRAPDGRGFIVMQYVEGQPLSAMLESGPLPPREALHLAASIAEALAVAHRRGIVHRDLKPSNVMVTPSGRPKLLDFGIAKQVVTPGAASDLPTSSSGVTTAGTIIGTPAYMSPEQIQQRPLDGRSDLFSLGALLFESLTGRRAFQGPTTIETIANVLHLQPPAPSTLRADLTDRHDELCAKLLAKDAVDRFQSADELVGAIRVLTETSRTTVSGVLPAPSGPRPLVARRAVIVATALLIVTTVGAIVWKRPTPLPVVPPEADAWYQRGLQAMRDGTYETGRRNLEQAIALFPDHVLARTRLADAYAKLDDDDMAQKQLLQVSALVPDESRLPEIERLRVQALRTSVLRNMDHAIELQRELVDREGHAGAWIDLGIAQESAGLRKDARESYLKAVALEPHSAAAHMRLGMAEALEGKLPEALKAFAEAERLYKQGTNVEGETEVLLQREAALEYAGDLRAARADLDRAMKLAEGPRSAGQRIRAQLALSRVTAIQGESAEASRLASAAVREAIENRLDTVAAEGLLDLAFTLQQQRRLDEADEQVRRALLLAENRGARRIVARARLQLASSQLGQGRSTEALTLIRSTLPFVRENTYRLLELDGLQIAVRAHQSLDQLERAREEALQVLALATTVKDDTSIALASTNLASVLTFLGQYPEALRHRLVAEAIHRRQDDNASLPFDLANRADLLIRMGRPADADVALAEIEAAAERGLEGYKAHLQRVTFLRAQASAFGLQCDRARTLLAAHDWNPTDGSASVLAPGIDGYCAARLRLRGRVVETVKVSPAMSRELAYWHALTALERGSADSALTLADEALTAMGQLPFDELRWRLAAVGTAAAAAAGNEAKRREFGDIASAALTRVRAEWKGDFETYGKRQDLVYLMRRSQLS
jgi:tetratricopeptide (TPR) repeat protein/predicted Ser/Thr protein kinase